MTRSTLSPTPFDALEDAFGVLCAGHRPLVLDGTAIAGLPGRAIPLTELRSMLLHPSTRRGTRNAAVGALLTRARAEGGASTVGLAGVLLFGLRRATAGLREICTDRVADIEAETLAGLVEAVGKIAPPRPGLAAQLIWSARERAERLVARELAEVGRPTHRRSSGVPARPYGHPDLILADAVQQGVVSARDAALIGETRLGHVTVARAARALDLAPDAAYKRRKRAEARLVAWLLGTGEPGPMWKPERESGDESRIAVSKTGAATPSLVDVGTRRDRVPPGDRRRATRPRPRR